MPAIAPINKAFALVHKVLRLEKGINQAPLAEALETTQSLISRFESAESDISLSAINKFAKLFDLKTSQLVSMSEEIMGIVANPSSLKSVPDKVTATNYIREVFKNHGVEVQNSNIASIYSFVESSGKSAIEAAVQR